MHGDLVNAICYTAFCPVYAYLWYLDPCPEARNVNVSFVWTMIFSWISYYYSSIWASVLAVSGMTVSIAFMNLYGWPHEGQVVVEPQFLWSLLIISGNGHLPYKPKLGLGGVALIGATYVAQKSPLVELTNVLPTLLGAFVVYCTFQTILMVTKNTKNNQVISAYGASILLAGSFSFHVTSEMIKIISTPGYAQSGGYAILVAGFFAIVGFFSSKAFQEEIFLNTRLEAAVQERTREVKQQAKRLVVVEHALQASETCIAVLDSDYSILWSNAAFKKMLTLDDRLGSGRMFDTFKLVVPPNKKGQEQEEKIKQSVGQGGASIVQQQTNTRTSEVKLGEQSFSIELSECPGVVVPTTTNKHSTNNNNTSSNNSSNNKTNRYLLVMKDITAQRARDVAEKAAAKKAAQTKAMQEAMQNLSHELRTPLQGIIGMTSLLLSNEQETSEEVAECMTMVMTSSRLLLTLINNMLDVQKMNANMLAELDLSSCNLPTILNSAVDFCLPLAMVHDLTIVTNTEDDHQNTYVQTNKLRLQQVVINLLSNAIKYSPAQGSIRIRTRRTSQGVHEVRRYMDKALASSVEPSNWTTTTESENDDNHDVGKKKKKTNGTDKHLQFAIVSVSDQGNGIPAEKAGQLFRRFASNWSTCPRVAEDNSKEQPFGTGLGLNLCKNFVERMNGVIWVENNVAEGGGATFSFALKADDPPPNTSTAVSKSSSSSSQPISRNNNVNNNNIKKKRYVPHVPKKRLNGANQPIPRAVPMTARATITTTSSSSSSSSSTNSSSSNNNNKTRTHQGRILVVDDVRMNLKVAQRLLFSIGCKDVDTALSGKEALSLIQKANHCDGENDKPYTLVISDLQMPFMSGLELSVAIQSLDVTNLPIVVGFTADSGPEVVAACLSSGMREVLHKPTTKDELQDLIVRLSASSPPKTYETTMPFGSV